MSTLGIAVIAVFGTLAAGLVALFAYTIHDIPYHGRYGDRYCDRPDCGYCKRRGRPKCIPPSA